MSAQIKNEDGIGGIIGQSLPRIEGLEKANGRAIYTDDISRPGMLHGALLGSHYAHARILSTDTSKAKALPGVKAVLVGTDIPFNYIGMFIKDQLPLARDKVPLYWRSRCRCRRGRSKNRTRSLTLNRNRIRRT